MSGIGPAGGADRGELLSALLDGELTAAEEAEVRAWLDADPEARAELASLTEIRSAVRALPPVDPPFGFYERMLRDGGGPTGRRDPAPSRWRGGGFVAAAAAVIVALVLVVGVTPPAEAMVPPVDRYTARHEAMTMGGSAAARRGGAPGSSVPGGPATSTSSTSVPGTTVPSPTTSEAAAVGTFVGSTATSQTATTATTGSSRPGAGDGSASTSSMPTGTTGRAPTTTARGPAGSTAPAPTGPASTTTSVVTAGSAATSGGYEPIDPAVLGDEVMAPPALAGAASRAAAYRGPGGVLHLVYVEAGDGTPVSVYEEPGMVEWGRLPDAGKRVEIGGDPGWWMRAGTSEVLVVEKGGMVFTLVGATSHEDMIELGDALPQPSEPSWAGRLQRAAEDCSRRFGLGA